MITENRKESKFKIVTCNTTQLVVQDDNKHKMIYREYAGIPKQNQNRILRWVQLTHPNILHLKKIQCVSAQNNASTFGLYLQFYAGNLQHYISHHGCAYEYDQIVNTFQPILQALDYLQTQNFQIYNITPHSIVITDQQEIKFVDQSVIDPFAKSTAHFNSNANTFQYRKQKMYSDLCLIIYNILVTTAKEKSCKTWKNRLQILKKKVSKQTYGFFISVYNRSLTGTEKIPKTKKIVKQKLINKKQKHKVLQGKQNQILQ